VLFLAPRWGMLAIRIREYSSDNLCTFLPFLFLAADLLKITVADFPLCGQD
jgi:hypothetical protein